jgi:3-oxoacyl-[acyl-carrier protein] reductase
MSNLRDKVAVVTGASKGIGAAIAKGLSAAGATVVVNYPSANEDAERVVADIKANGASPLLQCGKVRFGSRLCENAAARRTDRMDLPSDRD